MATLEVAVVGAGIAGLATAIGLSRAGHHVEIYERSRFSNETGAAINVCPNAARIVSAWGFDFQRAGAVKAYKGTVMSATTLEPSYVGNYEKFPETYGSWWYYVHRVDLHNELKRLAVDPPNGVNPAVLHLSAEVVDVDAETGKITFADGKTCTKDLIVAADGIHSHITTLVAGSAAPVPEETGQSAFRFLIPTEKIAKLDIDFSNFKPDPAGLTIATDGTRRLVWYPCRSGNVMNFVAIHNDRNQGNEKEGWNITAYKEDLLDEYKGFHPDLLKVCNIAEDLKLWKLLYRSPNPVWFHGKVALAGDAIHPMLPHHAQGGAQAIEDGAALGTLFTDLSSKDQIPARLKLYQEVRFNRAAAIQIFSNAGQDEAAKIQAEAAKYVKGPIPQNQAEFHKFNFTHDVIAASRALLAGAA